MTVDIVYGETRNRQAASSLADRLRSEAETGTIYLGYPVLATADETVDVDVLFVSVEHGLVAFIVAGRPPASEEEWIAATDAQDRLYVALESFLRRYPNLRNRRELALQVQAVTVFPEQTDSPPEWANGEFVSLDEVVSVVSDLPPIENNVYQAVQAAVQRVTSIKPAKRRSSVRQASSRGAIMKVIEQEIANLDQWQKRAAIETPEGPQRIRGLAGSGKTIVLALKAAYLHLQHPEWTIAVTFQSRALYQQILGLVRRFTFEQSNDEPDLDKLQIIHAWGSSGRLGVYTSIARALNVIPRDFNYARATYGQDDAFVGVCRELLSVSDEAAFEPIYDAILIDEAQDLPPEFFQLVHRFTRPPKRIVWAYDELQKLSEASMPGIDELFGRTATGDSVVSLSEEAGQPRKDIVLQVCYRNTPWSLTVAHGLGLGVYRPDGLVQHFDDPDLWLDIGYEVASGALTEGHEVSLRRSSASTPQFFERLLSSDDAVVLRSFEDELAHDTWVAEQIWTNLNADELEYDDILVVLPDAYTSKRRAARFSRALARRGVTSHLVGVGNSVDEVFMKESIAIAHIFRAKGNEAPMVYALDAQYINRGSNIVTRRNTLFTAVTRSRAWVRISGWGPEMDEVAREVEQTRSEHFELRFRIPSERELQSLRRINRDRTRQEAENLRRATRGLQTMLDALDRGEVALDELPPELRTRLLRKLSEDLDAEF